MSLVCNDQHLGQLTRVDLIGRVLYPRWSLKSGLTLRDVHSQTAMNGIDVGVLAPVEARGGRFGSLLWVLHPTYPSAVLGSRSLEWTGPSVGTGDVGQHAEISVTVCE